MSTFDVRLPTEEITCIKFADPDSNYYHAMTLEPAKDNRVNIYDEDSDKVVISDKEHALDLIKALYKAIELGWLK